MQDTVTYRDDRVETAYSKENLMYVSLIEKALAVVYGGYTNIAYFEAHEAISMITNCNYRIIKHKESCTDSLIESLKQIDSSTIMIASFDNSFSKDYGKGKDKNINQK